MKFSVSTPSPAQVTSDWASDYELMFQTCFVLMTDLCEVECLTIRGVDSFNALESRITLIL